MTDSRSGAPAAGWYADPTGQAGVRWWDGTQWTPHSAPTPSAGPGAPVGPRPRIPDSTPIYTPFIWLYVLLPMVPAIALFFYRPTFPAMPTGSTDPLRFEQETLAGLITPGYFVLIGLSLLTLVATIVMAFLDHRALLRAGVARPFHWAWAFLVFVSLGNLVYPIGRSVIAHQVARPRGLVPIWVLIGTVVLQFVLAIVWYATVMGPLFARLSTYR